MELRLSQHAFFVSYNIHQEHPPPFQAKITIKFIKKKKKQQKLPCFGNRWALAKHIENIFYTIIQDYVNFKNAMILI